MSTYKYVGPYIDRLHLAGECEGVKEQRDYQENGHINIIELTMKNIVKNGEATIDRRSEDKLGKNHQLWIIALLNLTHVCSLHYNIILILCNKDNTQPIWTTINQMPVEIEIIKRRNYSLSVHTIRKPQSSLNTQALKWIPQGTRKIWRPRNRWRREVTSGMNKKGYTHWNTLSPCHNARFWGEFSPMVHAPINEDLWSKQSSVSFGWCSCCCCCCCCYYYY